MKDEYPKKKVYQKTFCNANAWEIDTQINEFINSNGIDVVATQSYGFNDVHCRVVFFVKNL
jgi:hypothetical protein